MTTSRLASTILLALTLTAIAVDVVRGEPPEIKSVRVDGTDIAAMTGLDIYKYEIQLGKGQKARVTLDVQMEENAEPVNYIAQEVTAAKDGIATLTASFLRSDRKLASVFLSEEERMEFRLQWDGAASGGLSGYIKNPLGWIPLGEKALTVHQEPRKADRTAQLFLLFRTKHTEGRPLTLLYPRAALQVEFLE
jgi:hypothetical protein